jgi:hypothetical protein
MVGGGQFDNKDWHCYSGNLLYSIIIIYNLSVKYNVSLLFSLCQIFAIFFGHCDASNFAYTEVHAHFWTSAILPIFLIEIGITKKMA